MLASLPVAGPPFDLVVAGGTVLDPDAGLNGAMDVGVAGGVVTAIGPRLGRDGARVVDASGCYVTPGLIDLHSHVYWGVSEYGVEADKICLASGVTTAVDAGSSGAANFPGFRRYVMATSRTRILAFVHLAVHGIQPPPATELRDMSYADPVRAGETVRANPEHAVGIKIRLSADICADAEAGLRMAIEAAELADTRVMVHIGGTTLAMDTILDALRPGDVLTHCYTANKPSIIDESGQVIDSAWRARERGVVFDVGHGRGSCNFNLVRSALAHGFTPHSIGTDMHAFSIASPVVDVPTTLSKFMALGMTFPEVIAGATSGPARAIGWQDRLGRIEVGREADLAVLALDETPAKLRDSNGNELTADRTIKARWTIRAGEVFPPLRV